jgi:transglutaminase/protease-like cytokinesis protein 3
VISGGDKIKWSQIGKSPSLKAHAWNSVRVNNSWKLVDVTWGSGTVDKKKKMFYPEYTDVYFFLSPEKFYLKHFPKDTSWILENKTKDDFVRLPLFYESYLKSNITIASPADGVISLSEKDTINFKILNVPSLHSISYQYSTYQYSRNNNAYEKEPKNWNQIYSEYEIVNKLTRNGYLTIFCDLKPLATYKIIILDKYDR